MTRATGGKTSAVPKNNVQRVGLRVFMIYEDYNYTSKIAQLSTSHRKA
ncbi:hypothetical protein LV84_00642 [Algoriphagus ratkowskyi]|uniref:Uncharacterized protein n=1 Tax=Algoriphagus ratkowskyi TaxID=57028 RepID=A0A2W7RN28_9BACT|nr:hypothetical protein LV84_00642 [Algoriphagus ratkowskyi]